MVTFSQAQERADEWINGDLPGYQHREVRVREFELGFVVWAEDRADGPRSDGGAQRVVIARDSGEATLWPGLPVGEVIRRYEERYGRTDATTGPVPAQPPARVDLNQTSFLLTPPEWLQEAADKLGIPDRRSGASDADGTGAGAGDRAGPATEAGAAPGAAPADDGAPAAGAPAGPSLPPGATPWPVAGGGADDAGDASRQDAVPGVPEGATPWAGTDTNAGAEEDRSVPLPETVFAPPLSEQEEREEQERTPPPGVVPDANTALLSGGRVPGTPAAGTPAAGGPQDTPPPPPGPPGVPGAPGAPASGYVPTQLVSQLGPDGPEGTAGGPGTPGVPPPPTTPPAPGVPPSGGTPPGGVHHAPTMLSGPPVGGPGVPQPPGPPGAPGPHPPVRTPAGVENHAPTMLAGPSVLGPGGPGAPQPPGTPPGAPGAPGVPGAVHHAETVLSGPPAGHPGGPGAAQPPGPPPPPGPPGVPPGPPPAAYGYPQPPHQQQPPPAGPPTVGPGYQAVLRFRAPDGSEQQLIRRSAPGTPHPEWQIFHELRGLNIPPEAVLELHTELESCELPGAYCARMIREQWPNARITSIAPYGTDHASRQQGMAQLLAHQGELHEVADGPARPAPVRAPLPAVQAAPPVPPEGVAQELGGAFGPGIFRFEQQAVSRQGVPPLVAHSLVVAGLPVDVGPFFWAQAQPGRPVPTLAELAQERGVQPAADAGSYLVMGSDFGKALCVQYGTAHIVAVPVEAGPGGAPVPPQFVNTGLLEFQRCLALLGHMWRLRYGLNQEQAGRWTVDFQAQLAALDPAALESPESWWSVLLEEMWDGLL